MPSSIFSHQAPGLILKTKYPHKFDGTALCISTFVPDLNVFFELFLPIKVRNITHSILGVVLFTLPLTIILTMIFCAYFGPFSAKIAKKNGILSKPLKFLGVDKFDNLKKKKFNRKFVVVASYSALIGGMMHLLLDLPAHEYNELFFPWVILQNPDVFLYSIIDFGTVKIGSRLFEYNLTVYQLIWNIETVITFVITIYLLRYIKKHNLISKWYDQALSKKLSS
ncbi:hypothetical protein LCGC14_1007930 [marine sediment metagenome]|uniref:DUF4184 domain-containing protein n=1 Tax=marine sediment metagenome TaxID=412755 RepID=A0A0F9R7C2_9ZZZZ